MQRANKVMAGPPGRRNSVRDDDPRAGDLVVQATAILAEDEFAADLVFSDVPGRVAKALLDLGERFGVPVEGGVSVTHDMTQEELAQLVGASRETVNKALAEFSTRGWIQLDGRAVVLLDLQRLEKRAR